MGRLWRVHLQVEQVCDVNGEMVPGGAEGAQVAAILLADFHPACNLFATLAARCLIWSAKRQACLQLTTM